MATLEDLMYRTMEEFEGSGTLEMYIGLQELKPLEIKSTAKSIKISEEGGGAPLVRMDYRAHHGKEPMHLQYGPDIDAKRTGNEAADIIAEIIQKTKKSFKLPGSE